VKIQFDKNHQWSLASRNENETKGRKKKSHKIFSSLFSLFIFVAHTHSTSHYITYSNTSNRERERFGFFHFGMDGKARQKFEKRFHCRQKLNALLIHITIHSTYISDLILILRYLRHKKRDSEFI